ncbi:MAG: LytTR family DNA-binding domain-containing protein [Saprospiraceae bacterium]|nr:LytTR family DNA-binding domain-containing protein [Saprospiraceae bacterium]
MKVLIVEDEASAARDLCDVLLEVNPDIEILAVLESVKEGVEWITASTQLPELGFFDIQIADGNSFEILAQTRVPFPIIFTTAFDEYALQAFKVNSIDYILKPIKRSDLEIALNKYKKIYTPAAQYDALLAVIQELKQHQQKKYKKNFLVYFKDKILPLAVEDIAYFYLENQAVFCLTHQNEKYGIEQSLELIQTQINPDYFFRASRQFLVSRKAIKSASIYFSRKLKLEVVPPFGQELIISKLNTSKFKKWLTG